MNTSARHRPLTPLLFAYTRALPGTAALRRLPGLGPRYDAVLGASARFLYPDFVDRAPDADFADALARFYEACVSPPLHADVVRRRAGILRHGLASLLRGRDPLPVRAEACLSPAGPYFVAGLGPAFWGALLQGLAPASNPGWTPAAAEGLRRLGLAGPERGAPPAAAYAALQAAYAHVRAREPALTALHVDHFLTRVAAMRGRDLWADPPAGAPVCPVAAAVTRERRRLSLRDRLKQRGEAVAHAQALLADGLSRRDGNALAGALAAADPAGAGRSPLDGSASGETLTLWAGRLWEAEDPYAVLAAFWEADPLAGAGLWLPAAVLHLRDPQRFAPWDEDSRRGYATLDDAADPALPPADRYRLFNDGVSALRARHALHPLESPAVLAALGAGRDDSGAPAPPDFGGFCADTFHFLGELGHNNRRDWMERQRDRYRYAVREPLAELCRALAERYVGPVLRGTHGWDLDAEARRGRALTGICKNAYGRGGPYNTDLWIAFCRRRPGGPRDGAQLFVRLDAGGLRYGFRLGRRARAAAGRFRANVHEHAELLARLLRDGGAPASCRFGAADAAGETPGPASAADLRAWADGRSFEASRSLPPESPLAGRDDLVGEVLLTFDRLLPLFACATEDDPGPFLRRRAGGPASGDPFTAADFRRATYLGDDWCSRARGLLDLKRQLILQGVPGTGKTHVARCLARLLTGGRDDAVRLVQFHPAYSYEEFVEGIKVRSVAVDGRHDVTYPVEDGLLCSFAGEAARRPALPHVLVIDEVNRGNLPRVFGELLYLLEYRGQAVELPYSRRAFRLPPNLYVVATMNAADRSVTRVDQALRRRFSFLEMPPDAGVLASWLSGHVPSAGPEFADRVVALFERLNARLGADLGPQARFGHSYFMVPALDEPRLRAVWEHHVRPVLEEHFAGQPGRLAAYDLDALWAGAPRRGRRREAVTG